MNKILRVVTMMNIVAVVGGISQCSGYHKSLRAEAWVGTTPGRLTLLGTGLASAALGYRDSEGNMPLPCKVAVGTALGCFALAALPRVLLHTFAYLGCDSEAENEYSWRREIASDWERMHEIALDYPFSTPKTISRGVLTVAGLRKCSELPLKTGMPLVIGGLVALGYVHSLDNVFIR
jgi:hypothetical protein